MLQHCKDTPNLILICHLICISCKIVDRFPSRSVGTCRRPYTGTIFRWDSNYCFVTTTLWVVLYAAFETLIK